MVDYKFILEVARHGARAPSVLYDYTAPGQDNFPAPMELSDRGANQHYETGRYVQETYFPEGRPSTRVLSKDMRTAQVYA